MQQIGKLKQQYLDDLNAPLEWNDLSFETDLNNWPIRA